MATIMPQVSTLVEAIYQYPSQVLNPPLMSENNLTLPAAEAIQVPQANRVVVVNEEKGATGGTHLSITSHSSSTSMGWPVVTLPRKN